MRQRIILTPEEKKAHDERMKVIYDKWDKIKEETRLEFEIHKNDDLTDYKQHDLHKETYIPKIEKLKKSDQILQFKNDPDEDVICGIFIKTSKSVKICHTQNDKFFEAKFKDNDESIGEISEGYRIIGKIKDMYLDQELKTFNDIQIKLYSLKKIN